MSKEAMKTATYTCGVCGVSMQMEQPAQQEPWGACVYGRVFVGRLPEHARKFSEDEGVPIQWLYTSPPTQRTWVGLEKSDMPGGVNPLFDDPKFISGMVYAANVLMEKNT